MIDVKITRIVLDRRISKLSRRAKNTIPLMTEIAGDMLDAVEENFDREGRPKWAGLSPMTKKIRKGRGPILQPGNAGGLAASLNSRVSNNISAVGSNKKYAKYVTKGFRQKVTEKQRMYLGMKKGVWLKKGTVLRMPPRPFLKLTDGDVKGIENRVGRYFSGR